MNEDTLVRLLQMDRSAVYSIFKSAWSEYMMYLANMASDIYHSCIADYYDKYYPEVYDRHGDRSGFNLYAANLISSFTTDIDIDIDPFELLSYKGKGEKRDVVLKGVMNGIRGVGSSKNAASGWPRSWTTSYPNRFSNYGDWQSSATTIDDILDDFLENALDDTIDYLLDAFLSRV